MSTYKTGDPISDECRVEKGFESITNNALNSADKNPIAIATEMMKNDFINIHGPEHHYLVVAALLTAYHNAGGDIDLKTCLNKALQRTKNVPAGICGLWGSCGAGVGTGIFVSVITGATGMSVGEWRLSNLMTSRSLELIALNGGPRCCKRDTYLALISAVTFVKEHFNVEMESEDNLKCGFYHKNMQCKGTSCIFRAANQPSL